MPHNNKRQTRRRSLIYYLEVIDTNTKISIGRVIDISHGGFLCSGKATLKPDRRYDLRIKAPENVVQDDFILLEAECVRISPAPQNKESFDFAFEVTHLEESEKEKLEDLIFKLDMKTKIH